MIQLYCPVLHHKLYPYTLLSRDKRVLINIRTFFDDISHIIFTYLNRTGFFPRLNHIFLSYHTLRALAALNKRYLIQHFFFCYLVGVALNLGPSSKCCLTC